MIPLVDDLVENVVDPLLEDPLAVVPPVDVELPLDEVAPPLSDVEEDVENALEDPLPPRKAAPPEAPASVAARPVGGNCVELARVFGGPAKGGTFRPFWSPTLGGGTHAIRRRRPSPACLAERAGPDRPRPARTAGRSSQHEPRRQPGVRRRWKHRRHLHARLHRDLQPRNDHREHLRMVGAVHERYRALGISARRRISSPSCRRSMLLPASTCSSRRRRTLWWDCRFRRRTSRMRLRSTCLERPERSRWSAIRRLSAATEARRRVTRRSWRASSTSSVTARPTSSRAPARPVRLPIQPRRYGTGAGAPTPTTMRPTSRSARRRPGTRQRPPLRASVTRRRRSPLRLLQTVR